MGMHVCAQDSAAATADYRRQARKIRASFAKQPLLRHHALNELARKRNAEQPSPLRARVIRTSARRVPPATREMQFPVLFLRSASKLKSPMSDQRGLPAIVTGTPAAAIEQKFADHAASRLRSGVFTFTDRMELLKTAESLGISRFRANLIVALEQHRIDPHHAGLRTSGTSPSRWLPHILAIVAVEAAVVGLFVLALR
jgi:hypothetical protein